MRRILFALSSTVYGLAVMAAPFLIAAPAAQAATGEGLELSPVVVELNVKPGETTSTTLRLRNVTNVPFTVVPHLDDFQAKGEAGEPLVLGDSQSSGVYSMKNWLVSPGNIALTPNVYKNVVININVPANAEPGGHYGVVRFESAQSGPTSGAGVSLSASVGSLILLRVAGKLNEKLTYLNFSTYNKDKPTRFFEKGNITFGERVQNSGNVHEKPSGQVIVLASSGKKVASLTINDKGGNVLPGSTRTFTEAWSTKALFGHYTATAHLAYANGQTLESPIASFWIIPYHLIAYCLIGLVILFLVAKVVGSRYSLTVARSKR